MSKNDLNYNSNILFENKILTHHQDKYQFLNQHQPKTQKLQHLKNIYIIFIK